MFYRIKPGVVLLLCFTVFSLYGLDITADLGISVRPGNLYANFIGGIEHQSGPFRFIGEVGASNDGKYTGFEEGDFTFGFYYFLRNGGIEFDYEKLGIRVGRFLHRDILDSPYSLFVSSMDLSAPLLEISWTGNRFFYVNRWVQLNSRSPLYTITHIPQATLEELNDMDPDSIGPEPIDRSVNFTFYGVNLGRLRVGFQDALLYTRSFDFEYFANPVPGWFVQYVNRSGGKPWIREGNDNCIMGLFADWQGDDYYLMAQLLVDDLNLNRIMDPSGTQNPDKIAWMLGGRYQTQWGLFGLYHAGSTKYTFQPYGTDSRAGFPTNDRYGYTYYPTTTYRLGKHADGEEMTLDYVDNYLGYKYGENNIALMLDWQDRLYGYDLYGALEFTLSGSKSPANPAHEYFNWREGGFGTKMFDDPKLEKKIELKLQAERSFGNVTPYASLNLGGIFNKLKLESVPLRDDLEIPESWIDEDSDRDEAYWIEFLQQNNQEKIFRPSDTNKLIFRLTVGVRYTFNVN